jgi:thioredoxin-dependent peroxiredoxin
VKLRTGQIAPAFCLSDLFGRRVALDAYRGGHVLLSFHRSAACPFCSVRAYHLIRRAPLYQQMGLSLIAFYEATPERAHSYLDRLHAPYSIIVNPTHEIYDRYGLGTSALGLLWAMLARSSVMRTAKRLHLGAGADLLEMARNTDGALARLPGDFLVGPDGRIQLAHYGRDAGDFALFRDLETAAFGAPLDERIA